MVKIAKKRIYSNSLTFTSTVNQNIGQNCRFAKIEFALKSEFIRFWSPMQTVKIEVNR